MALKNPYSNVNWNTFERLQGNTHNHLFYQWHIDNAYNNGMRFIGAHPHFGKPLFPMSDYGMTLPEGAIEYALAEHYGNTSLPHPNHFSAIGSTIVTDEGEPHTGFDGTVFEFMDEVRNTLQVSDGGGIHWNHPGAINFIPTTSNTQLQWMMQMYDYAPDIFLGVEIYNNSQGKTYAGKEPFMKNWWDGLLRTGRQVWGFANPDYEARRLDPYPDWEGKLILLIPERTREACLRAIRKGQFFLVLYNNGFYFNKIEDVGNTVKVELTQSGNIKFKTATREVDFTNVSQAELTTNQADVYVRIEAQKDEEQIFSQPLMFVNDDGTPIPPININRLINRRSIIV